MTKARDLANIISGGFTADDIPNLDASKIVSGDISAARLSLATETKPVVSSVSPSTITNDATNIVITGTDFTAIPRVDIINTATGIWYSVNTVTRDSATQLTVNLTLTVDAGTYRIRVENPDGLAGLSSANFLTVSDAPTWSTSAGSLGTKTGGLNGAVSTLSASGDTIRYTETTNVLTNSSLANCALNNVTGAITTSDFDGSSTSARTHTFTIRATDAQGQTSDREFTLTSSYTYTINALVVAGGAGGGNGGGGAGGYRTNTISGVLAGSSLTVIVGAGGAAGSFYSLGASGTNSSLTGSSITDITSAGGGRGCTFGSSNALAGGSGGGGGAKDSGGAQNNGANGNTPSTNPSQGNNGGYGMGAGTHGGGGGGGAGAAGTNGGVGVGGAGGVGLSNSITGSAVYYAGGGGGGGTPNAGGTGGNGGGGTGGTGGSSASTAGTDGFGGGGGAGGYSGGGQAGASGGDGVVILSMPTSNYSGTTTGSPTISTSSGNTIIKFLANGTYTS